MPGAFAFPRLPTGACARRRRSSRSAIHRSVPRDVYRPFIYISPDASPVLTLPASRHAARPRNFCRCFRDAAAGALADSLWPCHMPDAMFTHRSDIMLMPCAMRDARAYGEPERSTGGAQKANAYARRAPADARGKQTRCAGARRGDMRTRVALQRSRR